jgi:MbtH protein
MDDTSLYRVIVNCEDEIALWPLHEGLPPHWRDTGVTGAKHECTSYVQRLETVRGSAEIRRIVEQAVIRP